MATWLAAELDGSARDHARREFVVAGSAEDVVRVIYLPYATSVQDFQEVATLVRSIGRIRFLFTYNASRAMALRGTPAQAALAEWLVAELNPASVHQPPQHTLGPYIVRVHYLSNTGTVRDFQKIAVLVRALTGIRFVFTQNRLRALVLRANPDQLAIAGDHRAARNSRPARGGHAHDRRTGPASLTCATPRSFGSIVRR